MLNGIGKQEDRESARMDYLNNLIFAGFRKTEMFEKLLFELPTWSGRAGVSSQPEEPQRWRRRLRPLTCWQCGRTGHVEWKFLSLLGNKQQLQHYRIISSVTKTAFLLDESMVYQSSYSWIPGLQSPSCTMLLGMWAGHEMLKEAAATPKWPWCNCQCRTLSILSQYQCHSDV